MGEEVEPRGIIMTRMVHCVGCVGIWAVVCNLAANEAMVLYQRTHSVILAWISTTVRKKKFRDYRHQHIEYTGQE